MAAENFKRHNDRRAAAERLSPPNPATNPAAAAKAGSTKAKPETELR
jgi:hypothetical protein